MAAYRGAQGMSLAEVILALGLCVVVILSAIQLSIVALHGNTKSSDKITADALAQELADTFIYGLPPASAPFWTATAFASPYQQDKVAMGSQDFTRTIYLSDESSVLPGLRALKVRVSWAEGTDSRAGQGLQATEVTRLVSPP
jgi:Tfp pilus assembly protein PilV